jgi:CheY-like chemotaxis protein
VARILLVDDDKDIRELGHAILANAGHDVFAVDGAISALEFLRSHYHHYRCKHAATFWL